MLPTPSHEGSVTIGGWRRETGQAGPERFGAMGPKVSFLCPGVERAAHKIASRQWLQGFGRGLCRTRERYYCGPLSRGY